MQTFQGVTRENFKRNRRWSTSERIRQKTKVQENMVDIGNKEIQQKKNNTRTREWAHKTKEKDYQQQLHPTDKGSMKAW